MKEKEKKKIVHVISINVYGIKNEFKCVYVGFIVAGVECLSIDCYRHNTMFGMYLNCDSQNLYAYFDLIFEYFRSATYERTCKCLCHAY